MPRAFFILAKSSVHPMSPKPTSVAHRRRTLIENRLFQSRVLIKNENSINNPPIVGVLSFEACESGVNSLALEAKWFLANLIKKLPRISDAAKAVNMEHIERTLMYLNKRKNG